MAAQVVKISRPAAELGYQLQKDGVTSEQIIGPLLMEIDVPNPSQRLLVEQALSTKQLTCFLARTDEARDKLNRMVGGQPINTYRYKGQYQPRQRPSSKELARFGVTGWLDEALVTKPEHRNDVLGILKDNTQADLMLLGTQETSNEIEELSKYLKSKGMTNVQVITPDVRRTVASNQRRQISAYSAPHAPGPRTGAARVRDQAEPVRPEGHHHGDEEPASVPEAL